MPNDTRCLHGDCPNPDTLPVRMYGGDPGDRVYLCREHAALNGLLPRVDWPAVRARNAQRRREEATQEAARD